jgi:hypothetical protein
MSGRDHEVCWDYDECILGCEDQECGYRKGDHVPICPNCGADDSMFDLVCGDHGTECVKCGELFTCP